MAYWRHFSHLVWATKDRQPLITAQIETELYRYIVGKIRNLECILHAIGGTEDHLHVVVSIPPKLAVADFVGKIKGSSSHHLNYHCAQNVTGFAWQRSYGSFSFGETQLPKAARYALNQKRHHHEGTTIALLERMDEEDDGPAPFMNLSDMTAYISGLTVREEEEPYGDEFPF